MSTFIPGYHAGLTVELNDIGVFGKTMGLNLTKTAPPKALFGAGWRRTLSGQKAGNFSAQGHIAAEGPIADLLASFESETPVAYTIQMGESAGASDAGAMSGNCVLTQLSVTVDAEGEWDWSFSADLDGANTHTPAA